MLQSQQSGHSSAVSKEGDKDVAYEGGRLDIFYHSLKFLLMISSV